MKPYKKNWNKGFVPCFELFYNPKKEEVNSHVSYPIENGKFVIFLLKFIISLISGEYAREAIDTDKNRNKKK